MIGTPNPRADKKRDFDRKSGPFALTLFLSVPLLINFIPHT